jgi:hypothetical protein
VIYEKRRQICEDFVKIFKSDLRNLSITANYRFTCFLFYDSLIISTGLFLLIFMTGKSEDMSMETKQTAGTKSTLANTNLNTVIPFSSSVA